MQVLSDRMRPMQMDQNCPGGKHPEQNQHDQKNPAFRFHLGTSPVCSARRVILAGTGNLSSIFYFEYSIVDIKSDISYF